MIKNLLKKIVSREYRRRIISIIKRPRPLFWGEFRRITPFSRKFGFDRGTPIDRYYIEKFLREHSEEIRGEVLEIADSTYTNKFGKAGCFHANVLHNTMGSPTSDYVGDLSTGVGIPKNAFDCLVITQTYPFIFDVNQAIFNSYHALRSGGILLATFPGISQISRYDMDRWGAYWSFTDHSVKKLLSEIFGIENVNIRTYGNVLVSSAFLYGLSFQELKTKELEYFDEDYQLIITARAKRT